MTRNVLRTALVACASVAATMATTSRARAANPLCSSLPNPVYVNGSTAVQPLLAELAEKLVGTTTIIYKSQGSCFGPDAILNGTKITGTAIYWTGAGTTTPSNCDLQDPNDANDTGRDVDVGASDVYAPSCVNLGITALPSDVGDFWGPVQVMNFIVPKASSVNAISAQVAYMLYGFGAANAGVSGFDDPNFVFQRSASSGTQTMIAAAIGVNPAKWSATSTSGSNDLFSKVTSSAEPGKTIGIVVSGDLDPHRDVAAGLAYQHWEQDKAYLPDSSPTAFDKANVRDGHYTIWGPLHLFAKIGSNGRPTNAAADELIGYFDGSRPLPAGADLLSTEIAASTIPQCAMHVSRDAEVGPVACYAPADPCDCFFAKAATGATTCATCTQDSDCTNGGACRRGYCEAY